jgi:pimeloyl-ACP methyl ester carboxylesterase
MTTHKISGGGGVQLHVAETGNPNGLPILFIHGYSQCWLSWDRQLNSDLVNDFRLIAMDLRGHGLSDKPLDGYVESKPWADDVHAVLEALHLDHPILCGWSYGPLIAFDYVRHYGEDAIGGIVSIGGVTTLGTDDALSVLTPDFLALVPGFFSDNTDESVRSLGSLLHLCLGEELLTEDFYRMLGYSLTTPSYVRRALFSRSCTNDDILPKLRKPVLIVQGEADRVVKPTIVEQHRARLPYAQIEMVPNSGHAPFWNDAVAFHKSLRAFAATVSGPQATAANL